MNKKKKKADIETVVLYKEECNMKQASFNFIHRTTLINDARDNNKGNMVI